MLDLYHASRGDLIQMVLAQQDHLAERDQADLKDHNPPIRECDDCYRPIDGTAA